MRTVMIIAAAFTLTTPSLCESQNVLSTQQSQGAMVSADLINALLGSSMFGRGVVIGGLPDGFPQNVLPPTVHVEGWMRLPGGGTISVASSTLDKDRAAALLDSAARAQGFERYAAGGSKDLEPGFHPAENAGGSSEALCRAQSEVFSVGAQPRSPSGSSLLIVHVRAPGVTCNPAGEQFLNPASGLGNAVPVPVLRHPPSSSPGNGGGSIGVPSSARSSGSGDHFSIHTNILSNLSTRQILQHYAAQLLTQGWTTVDSVQTSLAGIYTVTKTGTDGLKWNGSFSVHRFSEAGGFVELEFSASRR